MTRSEIVVGVDGSAESRSALEYGLAEAVRRNARVRVVGSYAYPAYSGLGYAYPMLISSAEIEASVFSAVQSMVDETLSRSATAPPLAIVVRPGPAGPLLVEESEDAEMLVVGHRGRGAVASRLLGSVGLHCVLHARCPVTVVRPAPVAASARSGRPVDIAAGVPLASSSPASAG